MFLFAICIFFSEMSILPIFIGFLFSQYLLSCKSSLYILDTIFIRYIFCKQFLPVCACLFFFFFLYIYFIYLFLTALGLRCCAWAFSSCGEQGLLFIAVRRLLIVVASLIAEHGLQAHGLQQLWHTGSVVVAHGLSCSMACGILPEQGSNPCPLHWQADS